MEKGSYVYLTKSNKILFLIQLRAGTDRRTIGVNLGSKLIGAYHSN